MAATTTISAWKIDSSLAHNHYYFDPLLNLNRSFNNMPSLHAAVKLTRSPPLISTASTFFRPSAAYRPLVVNASAEKPSEIGVHHHFRVLEIITFIWSLPGVFSRFFEKEEKLLDEVEEDIIKTANVVKGGAKVVEEVAEGLEEVAETMEKVAKTVDKDAKKLEDIMDEVKEKTRIAHDELQDVAGSLQGSVEVVEKDVTKVRVKVKRTKEESASIPNTQESPPTKEEPIDTITRSPNTLDYNPLQDLKLQWRSKSLLNYFQNVLKWPFFHVHIQPSLILRSTLLLATMLMVDFFLGIGVMTTSPLTI